MEHQIEKLFRRQHRAKLAIFAVVGLLVVLTLAVVVMTKNTDQALTFFISAAEPGVCRVSMSGVNSCNFGEGRGIRLYNATCPTRGGRTQSTAYFTPQSIQAGTSVCQSQEWFMSKLSVKDSPWYSCCTNWEAIGGQKQENVVKPTPDSNCNTGLIEGSFKLIKNAGSTCYTSYEYQCYNKKYELGKPDVVQIPLRSDGSCMPWAGFKNEADKICKKQYPCFNKTKPIKPDMPIVTTTLQLACNQKCSSGTETMSNLLYGTADSVCPSGYKCVDVNKNCPLGQYCPNVIDYRCRAESCLSDSNCSCGLAKTIPMVTITDLRPEKKSPVCGLVAAKGVSVTKQCGGSSICNINDKTCLDTQRFRYVNFYCTDGGMILKKYSLGETSSCKDRATWTQYAKDLCNDYMKCPQVVEAISDKCTQSCSCDPSSTCAQICSGACQTINNNYYCCVD